MAYVGMGCSVRMKLSERLSTRSVSSGSYSETWKVAEKNSGSSLTGATTRLIVSAPPGGRHKRRWAFVLASQFRWYLNGMRSAQWSKCK